MSRAELGTHGLKSWGGDLSRNVQKRGVQGAFKVTKRRDLYGRDYLGCRDLQAAIPEVLDALPTRCSQQPAWLMTLNFQQFDDVSLMAAQGIMRP